jgi:hypothetical protein
MAAGRDVRTDHDCPIAGGHAGDVVAHDRDRPLSALPDDSTGRLN